MACDIGIAAERAVFRQHEVQAGLIPGFGAMQRLGRIVGHGRAMELMTTGRDMSAAEALTFGYVTSVTFNGKAEAEAVRLGARLAETLNMAAYAVFKERMSASADEPFAAALRNDRIAFDRISQTDEARGAVASFAKRRSGG